MHSGICPATEGCHGDRGRRDCCQGLHGRSPVLRFAIQLYEILLLQAKEAGEGEEMEAAEEVEQPLPPRQRLRRELERERAARLGAQYRPKWEGPAFLYLPIPSPLCACFLKAATPRFSLNSSRTASLPPPIIPPHCPVAVCAEQWELENPDWRDDTVPELFEGKAIIDFVDPDIEVGAPFPHLSPPSQPLLATRLGGALEFTYAECCVYGMMGSCTGECCAAAPGGARTRGGTAGRGGGAYLGSWP